MNFCITGACAGLIVEISKIYALKNCGSIDKKAGPRYNKVQCYSPWHPRQKTGCSAVGSAPALGAGCRRFKSCHSDHRRRGLCIVRGDFFIKVVNALTPLLLLSAKSHVTLVNVLTMFRLATKYNGNIIEYIRVTCQQSDPFVFCTIFLHINI